ncbi:hypothetical protein BDDG_12881 [Blastomyces dermatitidis ATCC 18188]|uniref:Uncharacterized protein n=1 Tax=Ajellomyces dermatitidis (strain ATCC 18188 / CBS 674.68) TaxID=653446 RepID=A0A0J9ER73_AJEDA|nr:hypothetical protein BDDG_12881 [Blastomyces dermatitidis ATCC 18188]
MQSNQMAIITIDWTFDGMILNFENNPERMLIPYRPLSLAKDGSKSQLAVSELSSSCLRSSMLDILSTILAASSDAIVALATV